VLVSCDLIHLNKTAIRLFDLNRNNNEEFCVLGYNAV
jgi:hypothetical protein